MSQPFRLLISGGGVAGPVVAFWLSKVRNPSRSIHITIIERASSVLTTGQGIDIEGPAKKIMMRMGLLDTIKSRTTSETGFRCIDNDSQPYATFDQGGMTQEIEIMRGDLCDVLTSAIKQNPNIKLQYDRHVTKIDQLKDSVHVTITQANGSTYEEDYDAIIASDGVRSKTRNLMLNPSDTKDCIKSIDMYCAFFSIPTQPQDAIYSRWQHALYGRSLIIRPVTEKFSSVYLIAVGSHHPILTNAQSNRDQKLKRQAWTTAFSDLNYGEFPRVLQEMQTTTNFYSDQISQVKLPHWSKGRCALVGDAAYAPSPATGQGTLLAILGGYILAGELGKSLDDPSHAFQAYETNFRPYVEKSQQIPMGGKAPALFNPHTWWGIWILQSIMWIIARSKVWKIIPHDEGVGFELPEYDFVEV